MLCSAVGSSLRCVPNVCKACHRLGLLLVEGGKEIRVNCPAVAAGPCCVNPEGSDEELLVACHDVCKVPKGLWCVSVCSDVNVNFMESNA